jgi:hypothetical protein
MSDGMDRVEKYVVNSLTGTNQVFIARVKRRLTVLRPFFDVVEGRARFLPLGQVNPDGVRDSILKLFDIKNADIELHFYTSSDLDGLALGHEEYMFLMMQAGAIELSRVNQILGEQVFSEIVDLLKPMTEGTAKALMGQFPEFFSTAKPGLRAAVVGQHFVFCACYIGAVMLNDDETVKRLAPFVRTMAQVMVIGSPLSDPASWNVLCG